MQYIFFVSKKHIRKKCVLLKVLTTLYRSGESLYVLNRKNTIADDKTFTQHTICFYLLKKINKKEKNEEKFKFF